MLIIVVWSVFHKGASQLSIGFLTHNPPRFPGPGGGIAAAIVGTAVIVALATVIAMPLGVLIALYMTEFARGTRSARFMRLVLDLMNGLPSIVIGRLRLRPARRRARSRAASPARSRWRSSCCR